MDRQERLKNEIEKRAKSLYADMLHDAEKVIPSMEEARISRLEITAKGKKKSKVEVYESPFIIGSNDGKHFVESTLIKNRGR